MSEGFIADASVGVAWAVPSQASNTTVEGDFVSPQQCAELILKWSFAVMRLVPRDVIPHVLDLRKAYGENAVAILPSEIFQARVPLLYPE